MQELITASEEYVSRTEAQWKRFDERSKALDAGRRLLDEEEDALAQLLAAVTQGGTGEREQGLAYAHFLASDLGQRLSAMEQERVRDWERALDEQPERVDIDEEEQWQEWEAQQATFDAELAQLRQHRGRLQAAWATAERDERFHG